MTTIGPSSAFTGEITVQEDLIVEGRLHGYVHVREATLIVSESGSVKANVHGARVLVRGHVNGSIVASERIELAATARVDGSLSANRIVIVDGAVFNGSIDMAQRTIAAKLAQHRTAQANAR